MEILAEDRLGVDVDTQYGLRLRSRKNKIKKKAHTTAVAGFDETTIKHHEGFLKKNEKAETIDNNDGQHLRMIHAVSYV